MIGSVAQKKKRELLQLKLEYMREWTTMFFKQPHRCVMNILSGIRLNGIEKFDLKTPDHFLREIVDIEDILNDLQRGKLILLQQFKPKKGKKIQYVIIDFNFFNICQKLMGEIVETIRPKLEDLKNMESSQKRKVCKNCKIERTETEIMFLGMKCNCSNTEFVPVQTNTKDHQRLIFIQKKLQSRFLDKKIQINQMEKRVIYEIQKQKLREEDKSIRHYEQFCEKYEINSIRPSRLIRSNNIERLRGIYQYGRRQTISSVMELKLINQLRRTNAEEAPQQSEKIGRND